MEINIVSRDNGVGLSRDISLIRELLEECGHNVSVRNYGEGISKSQVDANIFCELVYGGYFSRARRNILIPNPEWYDLRWRHFLPRFTMIACKTKSAMSSMQSFNRRCKYISFTSVDRLDASVSKQEDQWLHIAGKSGQKGTNTVYNTWMQHPEFPHLTILQDPAKADTSRHQLNNLTLVYDHLPEDQLVQLQNSCGVHLCPSECEGFGHYIVEGLSCKSVVVTTDGSPMNELVTNNRGVLCPWQDKSKQNFAYSYKVSIKTLADTVKRTMSLTTAERDPLREAGRKFYEENDKFFRQAFKEAIQGSLHEKYRTHSSLAASRFLGSNTRTPTERQSKR